MKSITTRCVIITFCFASFMLNSIRLSGQAAPDFTITDSDGNAHTLYEDYLDQGKSVLIKIFFTTCPPCNQVAPFMEPFYQEWGAGEHDVEFFELSDKAFDTDEEVNAYKTTYGMTFPGAGSEGGSLEAVAPYKSGDFGSFTGTPTFVVIAPDGTVQFDVFGSGIAGQFEALDQALLETGAVKPVEMAEPVTVNGTVQTTIGENPLANVIIEVFESEAPGSELIMADTTGQDGQTGFTFFADSISADAVIRARKPGIAGNGLTGIDLVRIQRHLLAIETFTEGFQYLISDANGSNTISALDLVEFQKIILGIKEGFNDGKSWYLIPEEVEIPLNGNQVPSGFQDYIRLSEVVARTALSGGWPPSRYENSHKFPGRFPAAGKSRGRRLPPGP